MGPVFHRARPHHRSRRRPQLVRPRPQAGGRGVGRQPRSRTLEIVCVNFGAILTFCLGTSRPTGWHRNSSSARNSRLCWILRLVLTRLPVSGSVVCSPLFYACCVRFPDNFIVHRFTLLIDSFPLLLIFPQDEDEADAIVEVSPDREREVRVSISKAYLQHGSVPALPLALVLSLLHA